ncbi:hypothetical protein TSACC_3491 [Terrimicrobium sacchariphilum]|uniref:GLPGLI family protein n=1 Tax=Terrimicrobium sacchariphilum TaxID=690879 RepID=A0A146GG75_TERSA|nr:hypothetical protein [Terrimicrobium sacchariphilum]GAT35426.1 hypothetical protein TSACC_3491 [Terrimicrobium sacchariphilum]
MSIWKKVASLLVAGMSVAISSHGQEIPKPPFLQEHAPEMSRWTVAFQYGGKEGSRPTAPMVLGQRLSRVEVIKTGRIRSIVGTFAGGAVQEVWEQGPLQVLRDPGFQHEIVRRSTQRGGDFPEFWWIAADRYKGRQTVDQKECLVFSGEYFPLQFADPGLYAAATADENSVIELGSKVPVTAYIDPTSRLPVKLMVGDDVRVYTFGEPPTTQLAIPAEFQAALADVQQRYNAIVKPLSPP